MHEATSGFFKFSFQVQKDPIPIMTKGKGEFKLTPTPFFKLEVAPGTFYVLCKGSIRGPVIGT